METKLLAKRQLTTRFHIEVRVTEAGILSIEVVKTSNGQPIPLNEPLVLIRARDLFAIPLLLCYRALVQVAWYPDEEAKKEHLESNDRSIRSFEEFANLHPDKMKLPNITRGK